MQLLFCSVDKKWVNGSFSCDDGTRLYPESAVTGSLSVKDRRNVEIKCGKKTGKIPPPSSRGIYKFILYCRFLKNAFRGLFSGNCKS